VKLRLSRPFQKQGFNPLAFEIARSRPLRTFAVQGFIVHRENAQLSGQIHDRRTLRLQMFLAIDMLADG
jgi:hypothetical protein